MIELFGRVGGLGDPISGALARTPLSPTELREWCRIAILAIEMHEEGTAVVLFLMPDWNPEIPPAKNLALLGLRHLSELGGLLLASDLAVPVQAVKEFFDVLPILTQIEDWCAGGKVIKPKWQKSTGELFVGDQVVKRVRVSGAKNVVRILNEFEEFDWPTSIEDPLPGGRDSSRLRLAIQSLNANLSRLVFAADGTGGGITWRMR